MNLVEIHILQMIPPASLNRDDTGSVKDAWVGGFHRARISSQAQKRAVRMRFRELLKEDDLGVRTRLIVNELVRRLGEKFATTHPGRTPEEIRRVVTAALTGLQIKTEKTPPNRTEYMIFLGNREINALGDAIARHWDDLRTAAEKIDLAGRDKGPSSERGGRAKRRVAQEVPKGVRDALSKVLDGGKAADVALFGRMLADIAEFEVDAACQVAHAISTHRVDREFDFYTAVDDLSAREDPGAGMMGDTEYCSATFYRYANINLDLLLHNLGGDQDLAARAVDAFVRAFTVTLPSGRQNAFAPHSLPKFIGILVRKDSMPRNLAAAFESPVYPRDGKSLTGASVEALTEYWKELDKVYGKPAQEWVSIVNSSDGAVRYHSESGKPSLDEAVKAAMEGVGILLGEAAKAALMGVGTPWGA
jgi:CRISPR system Cascade subunit CasC